MHGQIRARTWSEARNNKLSFSTINPVTLNFPNPALRSLLARATVETQDAWKLFQQQADRTVLAPTIIKLDFTTITPSMNTIFKR
jgi:hypothetical protein